MSRLKLCATITLLVLASTAASAHLRDYLVTYPYWTLPQGRFEVETWNDFRDLDSGETLFIHQTEIEYGITDRLLLGVYGVFEKKGSGAMEYAKTKFETRYRLAEPGRLLVDPALYFEYKAGANGRSDAVETKLLLSKDFATYWNVTFNGILEKDRRAGAEWEGGFALGVSRWLSPKLTAGIELKGAGGKAYILPGAYINVGPGIRFNVGAAFGMTGKSDDFQLKTILEIENF